jgi:hypothetical protein
MEHSAAISRGARARALGRPITANPFPEDTASWHAWRNGWQRAPLDRSSARPSGSQRGTSKR